MFLLNSKPLRLGAAFTVDGTQYSSNWLRSSTAEQRASIGITEIPDPFRADDRFYYVTEQDEAPYIINTPKLLEDREEVDKEGNPMYVKVLGEVDGQPAMVDSDERLVSKGLKSQWIAQVKITAGTMLAQTDWMVIRKAERDVPIDADVVTKRAAILAEANRLEVAIAACADVEALIAVVNDQRW
jgi:hypothetical protein